MMVVAIIEAADERWGNEHLRSDRLIGGDIVGRDKIVVPSHIDDALRSVLDAIAAAPPRRLLAIVRDDDVCRRLMTVPGVGPVVALTYR